MIVDTALEEIPRAERLDTMPEKSLVGDGHNANGLSSRPENVV
jgi:hypothetical protein